MGRWSSGARGALLIVTILGGEAAAERLRYAIFPLPHYQDAKEEEAHWAQSTLAQKLAKRGALVLPQEKVSEAIKAAGAQGRECDQPCMMAVGRALGAHRVVGGTIFMMWKVHSAGIVWDLSLDQIDVSSGAQYGHFQRVCMCERPAREFFIGQLAERMMAFDPEKRLTIKGASVGKGEAREVEAMVYVPAGPFIMGSEDGEIDEEPRHVVELDAFYLDRYEVTFGEYNRCVQARRCVPSTATHNKDLNGPRQPVVGVGWSDGVSYCAFVGKRLPTEAEWEKAARGTDERKYPWGGDWRRKSVNLRGPEDGFAATAPVGSFPDNVSPYGAYDMAGNAWEWTHDFYERSYYRRSPRLNPRGPRSGELHTMRGGSWMYNVPFFAVTHNRSPGRPWIRKKYVGFRCAMDADRARELPSRRPDRGTRLDRPGLKWLFWPLGRNKTAEGPLGPPRLEQSCQRKM